MEEEIKKLKEENKKLKFYENHYRTIPKAFCALIEILLESFFIMIIIELVYKIINSYEVVGMLIILNLLLKLLFPLIVIILLIAIFHRLKK